MNWSGWLHGLLGAAIGGGANALVGVAQGDGLHGVEQHAFVGALVGAALYLKQSPLPASSVEVKQTTTVDVTKKD